MNLIHLTLFSYIWSLLKITSIYCSNKGQGLSTVLANKSQTFGQNNGFICRYSTQTKSFMAIIKTGMSLTQKCLLI